MSQVSARGYQIGIDTVTPANNFTIAVPSVQDGTLRLQRGNPGATTADIITVNLDNTVNFNYQVNNAYGNSAAATRRNKLDNAAFQINQRATGVITTTGQFVMDRWALNHTLSTQLQISGNPFAGVAAAPGQVTMNAGATATPVAGTYGGVFQVIEGYRIADLKWGTAGALPITVSFYAYCTITGTFPVAVRNTNGLNSYVTTFTVTSINTWQRYSFVVPGITTGTWATGNAAALGFGFSVINGTTFNAPAANSWQAGNYLNVAGTTNLMTAVNNNMSLAGIQIEAGTVATPFEFLPYGIDLIQCQRYFELIEGTSATNQPYYLSYQYKVTKRAAPSVGIFSGSTGGANFDNGNNSSNRLRCPVATLATTNVDWVIYASADI